MTLALRRRRLLLNKHLISAMTSDVPAVGSNDEQDAPKCSTVQLSRNSHTEFFNSRNWEAVRCYWSQIVSRATPVPSIIAGDEVYGFTNIQDIHAAGEREYAMKDPRYARKHTFALRLGYVGEQYDGYQQQKGVEGVHTVEDDLKEALGKSCVVAGRTDKHVSALSQIISFTFGAGIVTAESVMKSINESEAGRAGRIVAFECQRAPKRFHAQFSATWRRYVYLFPLNCTDPSAGMPSFDVDASRVAVLLSRLQGFELPYDAFSFGEERSSDKPGPSDLCTLYRTSATVLEIGNNEYCMCIELVGNRFLRRMVRILVASAVREATMDHSNDDVLVDIARSRDRSRASHDVPGVGLAMCGVGYDMRELAVNRHMKKSEKERILHGECINAASASSI